jgi:hypothetical protein
MTQLDPLLLFYFVGGLLAFGVGLLAHLNRRHPRQR